MERSVRSGEVGQETCAEHLRQVELSQVDRGLAAWSMLLSFVRVATIPQCLQPISDGRSKEHEIYIIFDHSFILLLMSWQYGDTVNKINPPCLGRRQPFLVNHCPVGLAFSAYAAVLGLPLCLLVLWDCSFLNGWQLNQNVKTWTLPNKHVGAGCMWMRLGPKVITWYNVCGR